MIPVLFTNLEWASVFFSRVGWGSGVGMVFCGFEWDWTGWDVDEGRGMRDASSIG